MKRFFIFVALVLVFLRSALAPAADMSAGTSFSDGQRLTAAQLMQLVNNATILGGFYTGKVIQTNLTATDYILIYSSGSGTYHRVSGGNFLLNNTDWMNTRAEKFALNTNDYFVFYDVDGGVVGKAGLTNIFYGGNASVIAGASQTTNWWNNFTLVAWDNTTSPTPSNYFRLTLTNLYDNLGTNWFNWFQLGPTNAAHTNITLPQATLTDEYRFWTSCGHTNGATTNFYTTFGQMRQALTNVSIIAEARDLVMQATNATIQLLTCTDMVLKATNGASYTTGPFTLTNDLSKTTITNAVDTGSAGVISNWYYIHVMSDGTNLATIASLSSNNPALPSPWIYRAMAGPAFYQTNSSYYTNYQVGREVFLYRSNVFAGTLTTAYAMQTLTAVSNAIPPIATQLYGNAGTTDTIGGQISLGADNSGLGAVDIALTTGSTSIDGMTGCAPFRLLLRTNQSFALKRGSFSASGFRVDITGYRF